MSQLAEIKKQLLNRKIKLEARVTAINDDVSHKHQPLSSDWSEQAVERENEEVLEALGNASLEEIAHINLALLRIEQGLYFVCHECGEKINEKRLALISYTDCCANCAAEQESALS